MTLDPGFDVHLESTSETPIPNPLKRAMVIGMQTCLDALAQQVLLLDDDARISYCNRASREFYAQQGRESPVGESFATAYLAGADVDPGARERVIRAVKMMLAGRVPSMTSEIACVCSGQDFWFTVHAERLPDGGALVSHYDISEIRALDDARTRFAALANDSVEYVLLLDHSGRTEYANVAARRLAQRLKAAIEPERPDPELAVWTALLAGHAALDAAQRTGTWHGELVFDAALGPDVSVKATIQAKGVENGSLVYYSVVLHDVTLDKQREEELHNRHVELERAYAQLKDAQEQLLQSEKMASIGQLASGVAHEINNPIGYVHSNLGTLQEYTRNLFTLLEGYERHFRESGAPPIAQRELSELRQRFDVDFVVQDLPQLLAESREGIERVKKIVQDLKDFSHAGQADEWVLADLHKGLDSTLNIVWNELKYKAEVHKHYAELPLVECLPMQINQVFMNILVNAGHAIRDRGTITLSSGCDESSVWIAIADDGAGIPDSVLQKIFDPFFTTKPVGQGTGLGLSLSYGIVKKHHGRIEVKSKPGEGSEFRIVLPIAQPRAADGVAA